MQNDKASDDNTKRRVYSVWFPALVERMMRLWLANVHHSVIALVLGPEITGSAVQRKAYRVGMLPRQGLSLIRDIGVARDIDRQAAPLPAVILDHRGKPRQLRTCAMTEVACYGDQAIRGSRPQSFNGPAFALDANTLGLCKTIKSQTTTRNAGSISIRGRFGGRQRYASSWLSA